VPGSLQINPFHFYYYYSSIFLQFHYSDRLPRSCRHVSFYPHRRWAKRPINASLGWWRRPVPWASWADAATDAGGLRSLIDGRRRVTRFASKIGDPLLATCSSLMSVWRILQQMSAVCLI